MLDTVPRSAIIAGIRHRRDLGDLTDLETSLKAVGMLHPIVIDRNHNLIAGARRLKAAERIGMDAVPVHIVDNLTQAELALKAERDENTCRKPLTRSEGVALAKALAKLEAPAAKKRQGVRSAQHPGKLPTGENGRARDRAAKAAGMSRRTFDKAEAVVDAADKDPQRYEPLREEMDRTGNVDKAHKTLRAGTPAITTSAMDVERVAITLEKPSEGVFFARLSHPSGQCINIRSREALADAVTQLQRVIRQWSNEERRHRSVHVEGTKVADRDVASPADAIEEGPASPATA
jgi:ParB-like chromosome segregation protein Spo0J